MHPRSVCCLERCTVAKCGMHKVPGAQLLLSLTPDGHHHAAPSTITPSPTNHPLPAQREQAKVQDDGQAHAQDDAHHYPEEATSTQPQAPSLRPSPPRTPSRPRLLLSSLRALFGFACVHRPTHPSTKPVSLHWYPCPQSIAPLPFPSTLLERHCLKDSPGIANVCALGLHTSIHIGLTYDKKPCGHDYVRYEYRNLVPNSSFPFPTFYP